MFSPDLSGSVYSPEFASLTDLGCIDRIEVCAILYSCFTQRMSFEEDFPHRPEKVQRYRPTPDKHALSRMYDEHLVAHESSTGRRDGNRSARCSTGHIRSNVGRGDNG